VHPPFVATADVHLFFPTKWKKKSWHCIGVTRADDEWKQLQKPAARFFFSFKKNHLTA